MRRALLDLLLCPRCRQGSLSSGSHTPDLTFGPLTCDSCGAAFPVAEGVVDLLGDGVRQSGRLQKGLEHPLLARSYESRLRPVLATALGGRRLDRESELLLYRSLLGTHSSPVLDLGCGSGLVARRLARTGAFPAVIGMDVSRAMLEEAVAQAREAQLPIDLLRAEAPRLPFGHGTLGAILHADGIHFLGEMDTLFQEAFRVLAPGGRYVASTYEYPGRAGALVHRAAGLHARRENQVRASLEAAGFSSVERVKTPPYLVFVATKV